MISPLPLPSPAGQRVPTIITWCSSHGKKEYLCDQWMNGQRAPKAGRIPRLLQENIRAQAGQLCRTGHLWHPSAEPCGVAWAELTGACTLGMPGICVSLVPQAETWLQPRCLGCRNLGQRLEDLMFYLTKPVGGKRMGWRSPDACHKMP